MNAAVTPSAQNVQIENALIALNALGDIVEDLRVQIDKIRQETHNAIEHIRCYEDCGTTTEGIAKALQDGWIDPGVDESDDDSFVAWCPACQVKHEEVEAKLNGRPPPRVLESVPRGLPAQPSGKPKALGTLFPLDHES